MSSRDHDFIQRRVLERFSFVNFERRNEKEIVQEFIFSEDKNKECLLWKNVNSKIKCVN